MTCVCEKRCSAVALLVVQKFLHVRFIFDCLGVSWLHRLFSVKPVASTESVTIYIHLYLYPG